MPPVRQGLSGLLQQSSSINLPLAKANLFFQTRTADIDLRPTRWTPHGGNGAPLLGPAPIRLNATDAFEDDAAGFNFFHCCLLAADEEPATGSTGLLHPPLGLRGLSS